ncbi:uncharacterized protein [Nicotiana sylvestris]|uniref:uncharacterized protein n=1 Tax=Nicotiana sylvestris TaxID=4096 RepID=UPI00388C6CD4
MYFPDEEVSFIGEDIAQSYDGWRMFFDGTTNFKGVVIGAILVLETVCPEMPPLSDTCKHDKGTFERAQRNKITMVVSRLGMDVIGSIKPAASNGHRFILVAIDYFTKWVEAASYKVVTNKVMTDFVRDCIVCRFRIPESIITNNGSNLNKDLMKAMCKSFKIRQKNSTVYRPQANPYMLVYGTEVVIPVEVEISSLRIIQETELDDTEWVKICYEQLALIDGKRMNAVCHGQLYQNRMYRAFNKRVKLRQFTPGQLVLKKKFLHQDEAKEKFSPN